MSAIRIDEIAPDVFRLSAYVPDFDMQFNHFLVRDEEPLLFHAGLKAMFPGLRDAVGTLIDPAALRHVAWSHFEFEETQQTLFCSDLFHHFGDVEAITGSDLIGPTRSAMQRLQQGPLAGYMPYTRQTEGVLRSLADLQPATLAVMHGSSYRGRCDELLKQLAGVIKDEFDQD